MEDLEEVQFGHLHHDTTRSRARNIRLLHSNTMPSEHFSNFVGPTIVVFFTVRSFRATRHHVHFFRSGDVASNTKRRYLLECICQGAQSQS